MRFILVPFLLLRLGVFAEEVPVKAVPKLDTFDFVTLSKATGIQSIPAGKNRDDAAVSARKIARLRRIYIEPAMLRMKDAPYAEKAAEFLEHSAAYIVGAKGATAKVAAMEGYPLYAQGCKDPLYYLWMGITTAAIGNESKNWISNAASEALKDPSLYGGLALWAKALEPNSRTADEKTKARLLACFKDTLAKENLREEEAAETLAAQLTFMSVLSSAGFEVELKKGYEESALPRWVKSTLIGILERDIAWKLRGGGWAATVTEQGWEGFRKHLGEARKELTRAWKENPDAPNAASAMISVTMGLESDNIDEIQRWFHRAIGAEFDFSPAYGYFENALQPKWGGSWTHILAFGEACMDTGRYDTDVPSRFLGALQNIAEQLPAWQAIYADKEIKRRLGMYFDRSLAQITDAKEKADMEGFAAVFAWLGADYERAAKLMETGTIPFNGGAVSLLNRVETGITTMLNESRILGGPAREDFLAARDARVNEKWDEATAAYERAKTKAPKSSLLYVDGEIALVGFERKLATGQWTKVPLSNGHPGWSRLAGTWVFSDGKMQLRGEGKAARVVFEGNIPERFEMRGRYALSPKKEKEFRTFSVMFGHSALQVNSKGKEYQAFQLWALPDGHGRVDLTRNMETPAKDRCKSASISDTGTFLIHRTKKAVSFSIDGEVVFKDFIALPYDAEDHPHVGFGTYSAPAGSKVDFTEIEIRRLGDET